LGCPKNDVNSQPVDRGFDSPLKLLSKGTQKVALNIGFALDARRHILWFPERGGPGDEQRNPYNTAIE
jgi:hypothetical protein